jgi:nucleotide-binding universal stress UspA family protein
LQNTIGSGRSTVPIQASSSPEVAATWTRPRARAAAVPDQPDTEPRTFLPIGRILVPIDFSDWSRAAVERAVALASPTRAEITGVFVQPCAAPAAGQTAGGSCAAEAADNMMSAMAEDVEEFLRPARTAGLPVRVSVRRGDTVTQILEQARETAADVIVMGTHGRSGVERWVLGSVLEGVLRKAPCPILAVPRPLVRSLPPGPVHGRILCAVGLSGRSAYTLSYALELGRYTSSLVTVLHVSDDLGGPRVRAIREAEDGRRLHAAVPPERPCQEVVLSGEAHREILRLAEAQQTALIVLGSDGDGLGPTGGRVVREARAPVLIVPFPS